MGRKLYDTKLYDTNRLSILIIRTLGRFHVGCNPARRLNVGVGSSVDTSVQNSILQVRHRGRSSTKKLF